jgi:two-component system cell cycle sensor histidine kinase/response regulator CckA
VSSATTSQVTATVFQQLVSALPEQALIVLSPAGIVESWNSGAEDLTGYVAAEVAGHSYSWLYRSGAEQTPEQPQESTETALAAAASSGKARLKKRLLRKDGLYCWVELTLFPLREAAGLVGFGLSIRSLDSQQPTAAEVSRDSQLLGSIRDAVVALDLDGVVTYWNDGATQLYGYSAQEMLGQPYARRYPESYHAGLAQFIRERACGQAFSGQFYDLRKDGSFVWLDARVWRYYDEKGCVIGILGVSHDLTDAKRAESAQHEKMEYERAVLDSIEAQIAVLDRAGNLRRVNSAWRAFSAANGQGSSSEEAASLAGRAIGGCYLSRHGSAQGESCAQAWELADAGIRSVLSGERPRFELEYASTLAMQPRWFLMIVTPLETEDGGAVVAHHEITQRRLAAITAREQVAKTAVSAAVGAAVAKSGELLPILKECCELLVSQLRYASVQSWVVDSTGQLLELRSFAGRMSGVDVAGAQLPLEGSVLGELARARRSYYRQDLRAGSGEPVPEFMSPADVSSVSVHPLLASGRLVGVLVAYCHNVLSATRQDSLREVAELIAQFLERKRTEEELRSREAQYRAVSETTEDVFLILDLSGRVLEVNDAAVTQVGVVRENILGRRLAQLVAPPLSEEIEALMAQVKQDGSALFECLIPQWNGQVWPAEIRASYWPMSGGRFFVFARNIADRKRAESALQASEERLRLALTSARMGVWSLSLQTLVMDLSEECREVLGMSAHQGRCETLAPLIHPDDLPQVGAAFTRTLTEGGMFMEELRVLRPTGDTRWISVLGQANRDGNHELTLMSGTVYDITHRKQVEQALLGQNRVLERIATGQAMRDVLEEIVGLVQEQVSGALCSIYLHDESASCLRFAAGRRLPADFAKLTAVIPVGEGVGSCGTAAFRGEPIICTDIAADPLWKDVGSIPLGFGLRSCWSIPILARQLDSQRSKQSRVLGTLAVYQRELAAPSATVRAIIAGATHLAAVVIERDASLQALRASEDRFQQIASAIGHIFWMVSLPAAKVLYVSPAFERVYHRSGASIMGDLAAWQEAVHPEDRERLMAALMRCARDSSSALLEIEYRILRPSGEVRWMFDCSRPLRDDQGQVYQMVGVAEDITDRKKLEAQFRQAQKMEAVGQLAGGVAHDFNNLLTVINGCCELLLAEASSHDPQYLLLMEVQEAGKRAAALTRQLLLFGRKAITTPIVLNLNGVVDSFGAMLRRVLGEDIALITVLAPRLHRVKADPGQLEQVLLNLAVNARDAMPDGGQLRIKTSNAELGPEEGADGKPGSYVLLAVTDTGCGMSEEVRAHLFEPFFTTKGVGKGTGLGLATAFGIIKQAGGHIRVETAVGQGSTFTILLPALLEGLALGSTGARFDAPHGTETVLLVEDQRDVMRLARLALERHGYTVLTALSGASAVELSDSYAGTIHLLVSDVVMPDLGGRDVADVLRRSRPEIKILLMSGYTNDAVVRHGVSNQVHDFLQKPFTPSMLARKVRAVLDATN